MTTVDFGPAAQRLADLIARTTADELGRPTPCPSYTLGDLIEHVGGMAVAFAAAARKDRGPAVEENPPGDAGRLGDDWRTRIPRDLAALGQAWQEPGA
ncbi:MAG: maleylpyruvate isomerase N-terminal domain-containing protein, partial [Actinobacteria bacterium]|nr:maleylpyruvate isomerase N-terminal domain-containing protein [Actinomycetota bacterium]